MRFIILLAAASAVLLPTVAMADTVPVAMVVPWGDWVAAVAPTLQLSLTVLVGAGVAVVARAMPALGGVIQMIQGEALLNTAIAMGANATVGAVKGKTLELHLVNPVLVSALEYVLEHGQGWIVASLGTPEQIAQKLFARLELPAASMAPNFAVVAAAAQRPSV